jgi:hypothetical protein
MKGLYQGRTVPGHHVVVDTEFCTVAPNVWGLAYITLRAPRILSWLLDFLKTCAPTLCMTVLLGGVTCMESKGFNVLVFNSLTLLMLSNDTLWCRITYCSVSDSLLVFFMILCFESS